MSKTKEQILDDYIDAEEAFTDYELKRIYGAMEEYAKEVCSPRWVKCSERFPGKDGVYFTKETDADSSLPSKEYKNRTRVFNTIYGWFCAHPWQNPFEPTILWLEESNTEGEPDLVASDNALSNVPCDAPVDSSNSNNQ